MTAAFFGMEAPAEAGGTALIDYSPKKTYDITLDGELQVVHADYVNFHAKHVSFWITSPNADDQNTLVLAVHADRLEEMEEVTQ